MTEAWIEIRPVEEAPGLTRRVAEKAAWRAIVREKLGGEVKIAYNRNGAPALGGTTATGDSPGYIGVSHTRGWVAVVWSPEPCAIDIEPKTRRLTPDVAARYGFTTIEEWCAFEAEYKYEGLTGRTPPPGSVRFVPHPDLTVAVIEATRRPETTILERHNNK